MIKHIVLILILLAVYFAADFLEKGIILNAMTPFPVLGIVFWVLLAYIVFIIVIQPLIQFHKLKSTGGAGVIKTAENLHKKLDAFKYENRETSWKSRIWYGLNSELSVKCEENSERWQEREKKLSALVGEYFKAENEENPKNGTAKEIIKKYSWSAGLCVAFSRNSFLDGMMILMAQMKMTVELAKLYGYKPSPLFNTLCFSWIATNSILTGLFAQAGSEAVGDVIAESVTNGEILEGSLMNTVISKTSSLAVEGLAAATTVYVTGGIVLMKLQGSPQPSLKSLFALRRAGRWELLKSVPEGVKKKLSLAD